MKCFLEPVAMILRAGPETDEFGKPYNFVCTVIVDGDRATLKGARGDFNVHAFKEIKKALAAIGIKRIFWERKKTFSKKVATAT